MSMLFYDTENSDWFNWLSLVYGGLSAAFSELNNGLMPLE